MKERRRHQRLQTDVPVILRHAGRLIPATIVNLSGGGTCLKAHGYSSSSGRPVEIIFDLASTKDISLRGNVRRMELKDGEASLGVQFANVFSNDQKVVQEYVNSKLNRVISREL